MPERLNKEQKSRERKALNRTTIRLRKIQRKLQGSLADGYLGELSADLQIASELTVGLKVARKQLELNGRITFTSAINQARLIASESGKQVIVSRNERKDWEVYA